MLVGTIEIKGYLKFGCFVRRGRRLSQKQRLLVVSDGARGVASTDRFKWPSTSVCTVDLRANASVSRFRNIVKELYNDSHLKGIAPSDLQIFANQAAYDAKRTKQMEEDWTIGPLGGSEMDALLVQVPDVGAKPVATPSFSVLNEPEVFAEECVAFQDWDVGVVHEIPSIWEFMKLLGGCTSKGKVFW